MTSHPREIMKQGRSRYNRPKHAKGNNGRGQESPVEKESIHVFCRLRPSNGSSSGVEGCVQYMNDKVVRVIPPERPSTKEMRYTFQQVFSESATQSDVFEAVGLPLIRNLIEGKNGLLFTYGVTGSGKTFTMTGGSSGLGGEAAGVMPRCIDLLFNSIAHRLAAPRTLKPDKLNGFELQTDLDALADRQKEFIANINFTRSNRNKMLKKDNDPDLASREVCPMKLNVPSDIMYSIFVTYIEVYNNAVYDLLEEGTDDFGRQRVVLQTKVVREDSSRNMYVHGATELEISSADEAFEVFCKGQRRKRMANTNLNQESSRSHSVFTIRLIQMSSPEEGRLNEVKRTVGISQLSLVDLAGSERTNRTKNTGLRLREAGNINNSLMTLRTCLELLRDNRMTGGNKVIPYRESRITHLFKTFFEGDGQVYMVVCINGHSDDYDETVQVMKFAEMSQEVQIICPTPHKMTLYTPSGRRAAGMMKRVNAESTDDSENDIFTVPTKLPKRTQESTIIKLLADFPDLSRPRLEDENHNPNLLAYFGANASKVNEFIEATRKKGELLRNMMTSFERDAGAAIAENQALKIMLNNEKSKVSEFESKVSTTETKMSIMRRKMEDCEHHVKKLKDELNGKESLLNRKKVEGEKVKQIYTNKIAHEKEKMKSEFERKLRSQKSALEMEMRSRDNKIQQMRRILSSESIAITPKVASSTASSNGAGGNGSAALPPHTPQLSPPTSSVVLQSAKKLGMTVCNRRHRRSRSADARCGRGDVWLEHRAAMAAALGTVLQPSIKKRKSVTKLTDIKDITDTSKYCLVTQNQDSEGDVETRLYKGNVIPTSGGGAQVVLNDVEVLKQESPIASPPRTRRAAGRRIAITPSMRNWLDVEQNCAIGVEGHSIHNKYKS